MVINSSPSAIDYGHVAKMHDYALFYSKNLSDTDTTQLTDENKVFKYSDKIGPFNLYPLYNGNVAFNPKTRPNLYYPFYLNPNNIIENEFFEIDLIEHNGWVKVFPVVSRKDGIQRIWRWGKDKSRSQLNKEIIGYKNEDGEFRIVQKTRLTGKVIRSLQIDKDISSRRGTGEVENIFGSKLFNFPKPIELIKRFIAVSVFDEDIVLDFFAGSATTAHAVIDLNSKDNCNRKFIMVQLPEPCDSDSDAFKAGYKTIADIGKERIRRVIKKLNSEQGDKIHLDQANNQDRGFKVFKLNKSNFKQWEKLDPSASPEKIAEQLQLHVDHVDHSSTQEDLLYEILLKAGFMPTEKIEMKSMAGKQVFSIAEGGLLICLEDEVTKELMNEVVELEPMQFICLDSAFNCNDQLKANAVQIFSARNQGREKANQIEFKTI